MSFSSTYGMQRKRKLEMDLNLTNSKRPKPKRDLNSERIMLENFVKYGILPGKHSVHRELVNVNHITPVSPIRSPDRQPAPRQQQRPFISAGVLKTHTQKLEEPQPKKQMEMKAPSKRSCALWRPWVGGNRTKSKQQNLKNENEDVQVVPSCNEVATKKRKPFTPIVTRWDTASPEFFKEFKQPVKLMYPRSKAVDYKFQDAQFLLQAFPVQATIGFYDDEDQNEKPFNKPRQRHLPVKKQSWVNENVASHKRVQLAN